jgi:tRNA (guanine37-N1)-methyltransferase
MEFHVVTLFPESFASFLGSGLLGKAIAAGRVRVAFHNPRDFAHDKHRSVDDTPYGGGSGMVMMPGPIADALDSIEAPTHRILMTPQGAPFTQAQAARLSREPGLALVCGRYEGVDERVRTLVDEEISIGDYVLLGGEVAAMVVIEATARLLPGALGNPASSADESHVDGLLEYPHYTRPADFRGLGVPNVLTSGDHGRIARWRRREALLRTRDRRPDLFARYVLTAEDHALLEGEEP